LGADNSAFGVNSLLSNTSGSDNSAFGGSSLLSNTGGSVNSAFGVRSLSSNTSGSSNSAFGGNSLFSNTTGFSNSAFGEGSLQSNTAGAENSAFGQGSLLLNTTGSGNVAMGYRALSANTTEEQNTAIGYQALTNSTAIRNTALGYSAGTLNTTGTGNVFVGRFAGSANTTGSQNVFLGVTAGSSLTTGSNNTFLGRNTSTSDANIINATAVGDSVQVAQSNTVILGNNANVGIGINTPAVRLQVFGDIRVGNAGTNGCLQRFDGAALSGTCTSDQNLKKDITYLDNMLGKVSALKVSTYSWNDIAVGKYKYAGNTEITGLIAQDVEMVFPHLVSTNSDGYKVVDNQPLTYYALSAIAELNAKLGDLSTDTPDGAQFSASVIWKKIASTLEFFGVKVTQGLVTLKDVVADNFFAKEVKTDKLCIGNTCVTEAQLAQLLQNASNVSTGGSTGGSGSGTSGETNGDTGGAQGSGTGTVASTTNLSIDPVELPAADPSPQVTSESLPLVEPAINQVLSVDAQPQI